MSSCILSFIFYYATLFNLDPLLVQSVVQVESGGIATLRGQAGEVGLLQLLPQSFNMTARELSDPEMNIAIGTKYLAEMKDKCVHQVDNTWIVCFNTGVFGGSKIKHPKKQSYYKKVIAQYNKLLGERQ